MMRLCVVLAALISLASASRGIARGRVTARAVQPMRKYPYASSSAPVTRRLMVLAEEDSSDFSDNFRKRVEKLRNERTLSEELDDEAKSNLPSADEIGVPTDQQPTKELENAKKNGLLFNWPSLPLPQYLTRVGGLYLIMAGLSFPFSLSGFDGHDLKAELITSNMVALGVLELVLLRLFVSWDYIGQRLLSDRVEYEQTGWYDGDVWEKPSQVVARDRLLHSSEVQPALARIQSSLLTFAVALLVSANSFNSVSKNVEDPRRTTRQSFLEQLKSPDENTRNRAMEEAIKAAGDKPAYCLDPYYRAQAGGFGCDK
mmetsp:Transcript_25675/g.35736  ORF Transcript_25675/g.35736 Transcript_25675/m.35736 type:complete len:315 (-) Transcript_25675:68-1012(-)|eukprot:CAMPEP_0184487718 /NCGR_PEP_ID=MMETSP0113_2-20130426/10289_1 /TAXON_ID=91329 /ORGANISM="Norrisiella sphaerica, Strain BC52" /LENGTH=314 /DNA_ID=CAMNT_0026870107 /DNA_START=171 /DNA_END=1115 /DNA_ORIENTATION=+